jgi:hypothetical protein
MSQTAHSRKMKYLKTLWLFLATSSGHNGGDTMNDERLVQLRISLSSL